MATTTKIGYDWDLHSRQNLDDSANAVPDVIDLTEWLDTIEEGDNMLAIYGANHTSQQGDFLIHPILTAERASGSVFRNRFMVTPTPGLENGAGYEGIIEDTLFTDDRGFYTSSFSLGISTTTPGTTIRYTTDGTRPTLTNGTSYGSPLTVDPSISFTDSGVVTIRAAAFKTGFYHTNVDTQTNIFLDDMLTDQDGTGVPDVADWGHSGPDWDVDADDVGAGLNDDLQAIPTMSLVMDWEELFGNSGGGDDDHGIYTQDAKWRNKSDERQASLEYFTADGSEEFQIEAKVEIQGHSSTPYEFRAGQTLAAGTRIVVARSPSDFTAYYGGGINLAAGPGYEPGNLSNSGELISLVGPSGELIQRFTYNDAGDWPTDADGDGPSLEYVGPLTGTENPIDVSPADPFDDPTNWQASAAYGGSPGTDGTGANHAPVITSNGGATADVFVPDGITAVTTVTATDIDLPSQTLTYSITGGVDSGHFGIVGATGVLTFNSPPDLYSPIDDNNDGTYVVEVMVSDGQGGFDVQTLNVTVVELPVGDPSNLRIVELHYNPNSSSAHEFIELVNAGSTSLSLDGVEIDLNAGAQNYVFENGQGLLPGERIVVVRDTAAFTSYYDPVTNGIKVATGLGYDEAPYDMSLSNTAETITLFAPGSVIIQRFYYEDGSPWPSAPDGTGPSMEYVGPLNLTENPEDGAPGDPFDDPANWQASDDNGGSPGLPDVPVNDADFDNSTRVTGSDFLIWQRNFGATGANNSTGDANEDTQVNGADLDIWQLQFGSSVPVGLASTSSLATASELAVPQTIPTGSQLAAQAALLWSPAAGDTAAHEAIFADETIELLLVDSTVELAAPVAGSEQSAQDEALATLWIDDAEDEPEADAILDLLEAGVV